MSCLGKCARLNWTALTNFYRGWEFGVALPFTNWKMLLNKDYSYITQATANPPSSAVLTVTDPPFPNLPNNYEDFVYDLDGNKLKNILVPQSSYPQYMGMGYELPGKFSTSNTDEITLDETPPVPLKANDPVLGKHIPQDFISTGGASQAGYTTIIKDIPLNHANALVVNQTESSYRSIELPVTSINKIDDAHGDYLFRLYYKSNAYIYAYMVILAYDENDVQVKATTVDIVNNTATPNWTQWEKRVNYENLDVHYLKIYVNTWGNGSNNGIFYMAYPAVFHTHNIRTTGVITQPIKPEKVEYRTINLEENGVFNDNGTWDSFREDSERFKYQIKADYALYPTNEYDIMQILQNLCLNGESIIFFPYSEQLPPFLIGKLKVEHKYGLWRTDKISFRLTFEEE